MSEHIYLDEASGWVSSLLKVFLSVLLLHLESKPRAQYALQTQHTTTDCVCICECVYICGCVCVCLSGSVDVHVRRKCTQSGCTADCVCICECACVQVHICEHVCVCVCVCVRVTHSRQGKEGDPQQSKASREQATRPRLRGLIPIANGRQGDLVSQVTYRR